MQWVVEDHGLLTRLLEDGERWAQDPTASAPGRLVARLRRGLRLSQRQLAESAGLHRSLVERIEAGRGLHLNSLRRLLAALGCGFVILPVSSELRARFRKEAAEKRRRDREWKKTTEELGLRRKARIPGGS